MMSQTCLTELKPFLPPFWFLEEQLQPGAVPVSFWKPPKLWTNIMSVHWSTQGNLRPFGFLPKHGSLMCGAPLGYPRQQRWQMWQRSCILVEQRWETWQPNSLVLKWQYLWATESKPGFLKCIFHPVTLPWPLQTRHLWRVVPSAAAWHGEEQSTSLNHSQRGLGQKSEKSS